MFTKRLLSKTHVKDDMIIFTQIQTSKEISCLPLRFCYNIDPYNNQ